MENRSKLKSISSSSLAARFGTIVWIFIALSTTILGRHGYAQAWNFGPQATDAKPVEWIVKQMIEKWPYESSGFRITEDIIKHEAGMLKLDCSKAAVELAWTPKWSLEKALDVTVQWFIGYLEGKDIQKLCELQIVEYELSV